MLNTYIKLALLTLLHIIGRVFLVLLICFGGIFILMAIHNCFDLYPKFSLGCLVGLIFTGWFIHHYNILLKKATH